MQCHEHPLASGTTKFLSKHQVFQDVSAKPILVAFDFSPFQPVLKPSSSVPSVHHVQHRADRVALPERHPCPARQGLELWQPGQQWRRGTIVVPPTGGSGVARVQWDGGRTYAYNVGQGRKFDCAVSAVSCTVLGKSSFKSEHSSENQ